MEKILSLDKITKDFPGVRALDEASLNVYKGKVMGLVGENGAGKSTILKILSGVHQPTKGNYFYMNERVEIKNVNDATKRGISIVHQELEMMKDLTVVENLFVGKELRTRIGTYNWKKMKSIAKKILLDLNVDFNVNDIVGNLAIGNQQMVEIAKAYLNNSKIICLDEPTSSLTNKEINALFEMIKRLRNEGTSFIYVSHRMDEIPEICDDITVFRDGKYIVEIPIKEFDENKIVNYIIGRNLEEQYPRIKTKNVEKSIEVSNWYAQGVKDASFYGNTGEILGFFGLMGAGRSELFKSIIGFNSKENGVLKIHGEIKEYMHPRDAISDKLFYLSEDRKGEGLILDFSHSRNISISSMKKFLFGKFPIINFSKENLHGANSIINNNIKASSYNEKTSALSGGNQQKVAIAKALTANPDFFIFDEPTRGIDVGAKHQIYEAMNKLKSEGKTVIMISSEIQEVIGMSDRIYVMADGEIIDELKYPNFSKDQIIKKIISKSVN